MSGDTFTLEELNRAVEVLKANPMPKSICPVCKQECYTIGDGLPPEMCVTCYMEKLEREQR